MTNPVDIFLKEVMEHILENSAFNITTFGEGLSEDSLNYKIGFMISNTDGLLFNHPDIKSFKMLKSDLYTYYKSSKVSKIVIERIFKLDYFSLFARIRSELTMPNIKIYEAYCDKDYINERLSAYMMNKALE